MQPHPLAEFFWAKVIRFGQNENLVSKNILSTAIGLFKYHMTAFEQF